MTVRISWSKRDALHIPSIRLQTWTWRCLAKMLVRKAGSRRTDTQSRISDQNNFLELIWKYDWEKNRTQARCTTHPLYPAQNFNMAMIGQNVREKSWITQDWYTIPNIGYKHLHPQNVIYLKTCLWEKPEACEMQYTSPIFELKHHRDVDLWKWLWENLHHGWCSKSPEFRIKTISWN